MEDPSLKPHEEDSLSKRLRLSLDVGVHGGSSYAKLKQNTTSHHRNHSLDYRLTNSVQQQTHHRNRSLDSVLQQIPESGSSHYHQPLHCQISKLHDTSSDSVSLDTPPSSASPSCINPVRDNTDRTSLASDDSGIFNSDDGERQQRLMPDTVHSHIPQHSSTYEMPKNNDLTEEVVDESVCDNTGIEGLANSSESLESKSEVVMFPKPPPKESLLLRLFESTLFDMSIAITYLFNSKEPGVQTYLVERRLSESIGTEHRSDNQNRIRSMQYMKPDTIRILKIICDDLPGFHRGHQD
ncbi:uncharacterized protein TNCV_4983091 [Trichonephila clavipes]|uniref:Uncharacterized protein n=1 Tax=Trichonephila clavipes TaxID=2585209 RepID=A0A8X6WHP3_TRICX|nr:uncharacterized protein TNCV_4983091 [Trichonephila clavipes]